MCNGKLTSVTYLRGRQVSVGRACADARTHRLLMARMRDSCRACYDADELRACQEYEEIQSIQVDVESRGGPTLG